jgi:hypothetical protein
VSELAGASGLGTWAGGTVGAGLRGGEVGEKVENILEAAEDGVVDGELAVEDLLEIGTDVAEAEVKTLEGLELICHPGRKGADGHVTDIS